MTIVWSWDGRRQQDLTFEAAVLSVERGQDATAATWAHCRRAIAALHAAAKRGGSVGINAQSALDAIASEASK